MEGFLSEIAEVRRLKVDGTNFTVAAGATDVTSESVDTKDYDGVEFICGFGAIVAGAVTSIKVRQDIVAAMSAGADIAGTAITVADTDDNKITRSGIIRPRERFLDHVVKRATQNATVDFLLAVLHKAHKVPITQHSTVIKAETFVSPAEGTA